VSTEVETIMSQPAAPGPAPTKRSPLPWILAVVLVGFLLLVLCGGAALFVLVTHVEPQPSAPATYETGK
jgi:hypothetical protein